MVKGIKKQTDIGIDYEKLKQELLSELKSLWGSQTQTQEKEEPVQTPKDLFKTQQQQPSTKPKLFTPEGFQEPQKTTVEQPIRAGNIQGTNQTGPMQPEGSEVEQPKVKLTQEEINKLAEDNPGFAVDEFGNLRNIAETEAQVRFNTEELAAGAGVTMQELERQQEQRAKLQALIQKAQMGQLTAKDMVEIQGADIDWNQVLGAGAVGVAPGLLGGAATGIGASVLGGAIAGGTVGSVVPGVGTVALAAVGALTGFLTAVRSNLKSQQSGEYTADKEVLRKAQTALAGYITLVNQDPRQAPMAIEGFYATLADVDRAYAKTHKDSQESLNRWLSLDGTPELAKFQVFNERLRPMYEQRFMAALGSPNSQESMMTQEDWLLISETMGE